jgi:hypothetical protein
MDLSIDASGSYIFLSEENLKLFSLPISFYEMSAPKFEFVPNVGKDIKLVAISELPERIPPPNENEHIENQGPEWEQFMVCWHQVWEYYENTSEGRHWRPRCSLLDQFLYACPNFDYGLWSGVFQFLKFYQELLQDPEREKWSDEHIKEKIWNCVVGGRLHVMLGKTRVWDDWKA